MKEKYSLNVPKNTNNVINPETTHYIFILDRSYSMRNTYENSQYRRFDYLTIALENFLITKIGTKQSMNEYVKFPDYVTILLYNDQVINYGLKFFKFLQIKYDENQILKLKEYNVN